MSRLSKSAQAKACRQRFSEEHNVPLDWIAAMRRLADHRALCATHVCNGDYHPECVALSTERETHGSFWNAEDCAAREKLGITAAMYGFEVEYNGLFPTLTKGPHSYWIPE